jgi:hypothetical protein
MINFPRFIVFAVISFIVSMSTMLLFTLGSPQVAQHVASMLFGAGTGLCLCYWKKRTHLDPTKLLPLLDELRLHRWVGGQKVKTQARLWIAFYRPAFAATVIMGPVAALLCSVDWDGASFYLLPIAAWVLPASALYLWCLGRVHATIFETRLSMHDKPCYKGQIPVTYDGQTTILRANAFGGVRAFCVALRYSPEWWRNQLSQAIGTPTIMLRKPDQASEHGAVWEGPAGQWLHARPNVPRVYRHGQTWLRSTKTSIGWTFRQGANALPLTAIRRVMRRRQLSDWYLTVDPAISITRSGINYVWERKPSAEAEQWISDRNVSNFLRVS